MSAVTLIVTAAGRAALVNAAAAGTNAVTIAQAGLTSLAFTAAPSMTGLPGEFRRITAVAGAAVDADTIHLVIRDDSEASYDLTGFGLYLADGTLFALYGQADPILEKSPQSTALIAVDVRFADITAASLEFSGDGFLNPPATTTVAGVVELATGEEASAGTDAIRAVTPAGLKAAIDARFGANAASAFVRGLLDRTSAAAFRLALSIRSAALKDEGAGNGLDADLLDGLQTHNVPAAQAGGNWPSVPIINNAGATDIGRFLDFHAAPNNPGDFTIRVGLDGANRLTVNGGIFWHTGNDGAGSGLDADLLDGQDSAFYTNIPARLGYTPWHAGNDGSGSGLDADLLDGLDASFFTNIPARLGYTPWHPGNDGSGSGLDADLLDGRDSTSFANAAHGHGAADIAGAFPGTLGANGWTRLPNGLIMAWGQYRSFVSGEVTRNIPFDGVPFTEAPWSVQCTGINPAANFARDIIVQVVARDPGSFTVFMQRPADSTAAIDGFDWLVIGR